MKRSFALFALIASVLTPLLGFGQRAPMPQAIHSGLWRVDHNFRATLRIRNVSLAEAINVSPILYMQDGFAYVLPQLEIPAADLRTININDALLRAQGEIRNHISQYGSIEIRFQSASTVRISASVELLDPVASLSFVSQCGGRGSSSSATQVLEGLWWKHDEAVGGFVALTNATSRAISGSYQIVTSQGRSLSMHSVSLRAHELRWIDLEEVLAELPAGESKNGGLRVAYSGKAGDLLVMGGLENWAEGYSATIPFVSTASDAQASAHEQTYASVGLMTGIPMAMMGFPSETKFSLYSIIRNTTESSIKVSVAINYMGESGAITVPAAMIELAPLQTKQLDSFRLLKQAGLTNFDGSINLTFTFNGKDGDLVLATGSVDQRGTYVFAVQPQGLSESLSKQVPYWSIANGNDTMIGLMNGAAGAEDLILTFYFAGGGHYNFPVHLSGHSSSNVDLMDLVMQRQPDAEGNLFQSSSEGSAVFASAAGETKPISLAVSVGVFNVNTATCNNYCIYCSGWTDFYLLPDSFTLTPGGTVQLTAYGTFMDDRNNTNRTYTLTPLLWNSSGSAASVSQSGLVTGQNAGTASVTAQENLTPESGVSPDCSFQCSPDYIRTSAPSSGTVQPTISGPTDVWYFGGQNPSQYATSITLQTQGSATWNVTQGASEINITPSGSQATITATGNSVSNNVGDAQITATVNNVTSQPFKLSTRRPFYSSSLGTTPACDSTYGYLDVINYNVDDNLSTAMPYSIGVNETFPPFSCNTLNGAVIDQPCNDYNGTNWKWGPIGGFQTAPSTPAQFGDSIGGQQLSLSPNPIPVCTGDSTAVQHWYQEWRMGSTQVGAGSRFQTDYIHKFVNHAEHQNIQTGSGVQP